MSRRLHVSTVEVGDVSIDSSQLHHARQVLRLEDGAIVELFDDAGRTASGPLRGDHVTVTDVVQPSRVTRRLTMASAVPKGDRADWMVEKLSELGVHEWIPLAAERSVSLPEGRSKRSRWERIAVESAKQSRRTGVMRIGPLSQPNVSKPNVNNPNVSNPLAAEITRDDEARWYLSTRPNAIPIGSCVQHSGTGGLIIYVGPEGGWTEREMDAFDAASLTAVKLTDTILRVETAAVAAAAVLLVGGHLTSESKAT